MEKKVFRSRISVFNIIICCACLLPLLNLMIRYGFIVFGSIFGIVMILGLFSLRSVYYVLTDKEIHVNYFWFKVGIIYISGISSIERSYNLFGSFAMSMKSLRFNFRKGYKWHVYFSNNSLFFTTTLPWISPVREQDFLETLKTLNPNIQINVTDKKGWWWRLLGWDI